VIFTGCRDPDVDKAFKTADKLYRSVKIVVTDPEVSALIPDKTMGKLAALEKKYILGKSLINELSAVEGKDALTILAECSDEVLDILADLTSDKHKDQITIIRNAVKVLQVYLEPG
jgi:hypothetical protein